MRRHVLHSKGTRSATAPALRAPPWPGCAVSDRHGPPTRPRAPRTFCTSAPSALKSDASDSSFALTPPAAAAIVARAEPYGANKHHPGAGGGG